MTPDLGLSTPDPQRRWNAGQGRVDVAEIATETMPEQLLPQVPNAVWCIDFKGPLHTDDGQICYPLTLSDAFSRCLLRCELVEEPTCENVEFVLDSAERELVLPRRPRKREKEPLW